MSPRVSTVSSKVNVIGMDTAGSSSSGGFGFEETGTTPTQAYTIPINTALTIAKSIKNGDGSNTIRIGTIAFLGVEVRDATSASSGTQGGSSTATSGVTVAEVIPNTSAESTASKKDGAHDSTNREHRLLDFDLPD